MKRDHNFKRIFFKRRKKYMFVTWWIMWSQRFFIWGWFCFIHFKMDVSRTSVHADGDEMAE